MLWKTAEVHLSVVANSLLGCWRRVIVTISVSNGVLSCSLSECLHSKGVASVSLSCCSRRIGTCIGGVASVMSERGSVRDESVSESQSCCIVLVSGPCAVCLMCRNRRSCCNNAGGVAGGVASESVLISMKSRCVGIMSSRMQSVSVVHLSHSVSILSLSVALSERLPSVLAS